MISMIVIMADDEAGLSLDQVEERLSDHLFMYRSLVRLLTRWRTNVDVKLPVFTMNEEYDLKDTLKNMGMESMFDSETADFRGIDASGDIHVDQVPHKTFFKAGQDSTAPSMTEQQTMSRHTFHATKPFHFAVFDHYTHSILFASRVFDP